MKKKILGVTFIAAFALAIGWNMNQTNNEVNLSDLTLDNVEALAGGEGGSGGHCSRSGYMCIIKYSDGSSTSINGRWN